MTSLGKSMTLDKSDSELSLTHVVKG